MRKNLIASEGGSVYLFSICGISILSSLFYYVMAGRVGSFAGMSIADWVGYAVTQVAIVLVVYLFRCGANTTFSPSANFALAAIPCGIFCCSR